MVEMSVLVSCRYVGCEVLGWFWFLLCLVWIYFSQFFGRFSFRDKHHLE